MKESFPVSFPEGNSLACTSWTFCLCMCAHMCAHGSTRTHTDSRGMKLLVPWYSPSAESPGDLLQQLRAGAMWHQCARISSQAGLSTSQAGLFTDSFPNWQEMEGFVCWFSLPRPGAVPPGSIRLLGAPALLRAANPALLFASVWETSP